MTRDEINIEQVKQSPYDVPGSIFIPAEKFTKTTQFLLPAIDLNVRKPTIFQYFDNAFLDDEGYEHSYDACIFVLFKVRNLEDTVWQAIFTYLQSKPEYVIDYNVGMMDSAHQIMVVFKIPTELEDMYYKFKRGKYSEFPEEYKKKFPQEVFPDGKKKESIVWGAMYKSPVLKEHVEREFYGPDSKYSLDPEKDEYWERPRRHREHFRCNPDHLKRFSDNIERLRTLYS